MAPGRPLLRLALASTLALTVALASAEGQHLRSKYEPLDLHPGGKPAKVRLGPVGLAPGLAVREGSSTVGLAEESMTSVDSGEASSFSSEVVEPLAMSGHGGIPNHDLKRDSRHPLRLQVHSRAQALPGADSADVVSSARTRLVQRHPADVQPSATIAKHTRTKSRTEDDDHSPVPHEVQPFRQTLHNFGDVQYAGDFQVGGQQLRGVMDTGSFELLVFSKQCTKCGNNTAAMYDAVASPTHIEGGLLAEHAFGSGIALSAQAYDTVQIGPYKAFGQPFWEVFDAAMPVLQDSSFQAIVGVGPPGSAERLASQAASGSRVHDIHDFEEAEKAASDPEKAEAAPTEFHEGSKEAFSAQPLSADRTQKENLCMNLGIRTFSVCIGAESGEPGHFIWNDNSHQVWPEVFTSVPVVGQIHWGVLMTAAQMGRGDDGDDIVSLGCKDGCGAVIDTGTSLIAAPPDVIARVEQEMLKLDEDCTNLHELPDLVFNLGGREFSLPPDAYIGKVVGKGPPRLRDLLHFKWRRTRCEPLLMSIDTPTQYGPMWILGLPFFRKYYTTFGFSVEDSGVQKHLSIARADSHCNPESEASLMAVPRKNMAPRRIDASQLHVPSWVAQAATASSRGLFQM